MASYTPLSGSLMRIERPSSTRLSTVRVASSGEAPSTMMCSMCGWVCARTLATVSASSSPAL